jgi:hypothetical protein
VRGGARFRLLAHSQTETGVKRYFFYFSVPSTTEGQSQILNGIKNISFLAFFFANDINIYIFAVSNNSNNNPI